MGEKLAQQLQENLLGIQETVRQTALDSGRNPDELHLVVVTKEKSAVVVKELAELGIHQIGESYLKEARFKMELLDKYPISWHMIGHIQSGKAKQVARLFDIVHSVDRLDLARSLSEGAEAHGKILPVFLECNISGEETKYGWEASDLELWDDLADQMTPVFALEGLNVLGLMTMAPYSRDPEQARPYFQRLNKLSGYLRSQFPGKLGGQLSMGMSGDFQVAIEEGATYLRIGSKIVGTRG
jgi:hypothetical protein